MLCIKVEKRTKLEGLICLGASPAPQVVIFHVEFVGVQSNGGQSSRGKFRGGNHPGGNILGAKFRGAIFWVAIFQGRICWVVVSRGAILRSPNRYQEENCPALWGRNLISTSNRRVKSVLAGRVEISSRQTEIM